jgi:hypothetical protein
MSTRRSVFINFFPNSLKIIAGVACLFLLHCDPIPDSPHWTNVSSDYGFFVEKGYFVDPPTFPVSVCMARGNEINASQAKTIATAITLWERDLMGHLGCKVFDIQPVGSDCTIQIGGVKAEYDNHWEETFIALAMVYTKKVSRGQKVTRCYINVPETTWSRERVVTTIRHELGHCLGLNDDPITADDPISLMCGTELPWPARLTAMDARLIISNHNCH